MTGMNENTIKVKLFRARQKLVKAAQRLEKARCPHGIEALRCGRWLGVELSQERTLRSARLGSFFEGNHARVHSGSIRGSATAE